MNRKARTDPLEELKKELKRGMDDPEGKRDEHRAIKNGAIEGEGQASLPCADMTCPCRVLNRPAVLPPERCLKR
jgi:hypothetical protein